MKKILTSTIVILLLIFAGWFVFSGFRINPTVAIIGYEISQDGTEIYVYQGDGEYSLVLKKYPITGEWTRTE